MLSFELDDLRNGMTSGFYLFQFKNILHLNFSVNSFWIVLFSFPNIIFNTFNLNWCTSVLLCKLVIRRFITYTRLNFIWAQLPYLDGGGCDHGTERHVRFVPTLPWIRSSSVDAWRDCSREGRCRYTPVCAPVLYCVYGQFGVRCGVGSTNVRFVVLSVRFTWCTLVPLKILFV